MTGNVADPGGAPQINPDAGPFLLLLSEHPDLLHPVHGEPDRDLVDLRRIQGHPCTRCGNVSAMAYVAGTSAGSRWVDLCAPCDAWFRGIGPDPLAR